jgi:vitamin B12 transporter
MNYEVGLRHLFADAGATVELVLYRIDAKDFIERPPGGGAAENFDEYRFQGVEFTAALRPIDPLLVAFGYTYLDAENRSPGADTRTLQNRPEHKYSLAADYDMATGTTLRLEVIRATDSYALSRTTPTTTLKLDSYTVVNLVVSQDLPGDRVRVFARAQNLLDENYAESFGFEQPGRTIFVGGDILF